MSGSSKEQQLWEACTSIDIARKVERPEIVSLLERFIADPAQTRHEVRVKLGVLDELAAEVFALTIFLCDDLLHLKPSPAATTTLRFLPLPEGCPWSCK